LLDLYASTPRTPRDFYGAACGAGNSTASDSDANGPFGPYVCDFICLEAKLIVELDGSQHVEQMNYDARRDDFMRSYGYRIVRFWNGDVLSRTDTVVETIFEALHRPEMDGRLDR
jgi:Protein of unknown function (DUF559)